VLHHRTRAAVAAAIAAVAAAIAAVASAAVASTAAAAGFGAALAGISCLLCAEQRLCVFDSQIKRKRESATVEIGISFICIMRQGRRLSVL
jgi:hypothetical protein